MDFRSLAIVVREDFRQADSLHTVHIFVLPGDVPDPAGKIYEAISQNRPFDNYSIDNTHSVIETGASGASQEVIFTLGEAIFSGAAEAIVGALIGWALSELKHRGNNLPHIELDAHIDEAKRNIRRHFAVTGELHVLRAEKTGVGVHILLGDSLGRHYQAEFGNDGHQKLEKVKS
jgi:hypothetical protein